MTVRIHLAVRAAVAITSVVVSALVLLPHDVGVAPERMPIPDRPARETTGLEALPTVFQTPSATMSDPGVDDGRPKLIGVAGRLPDDAVALVRLPGEPTKTIKVGDTVMAWRLSELTVDRATFVRGGERYVSALDPVE